MAGGGRWLAGWHVWGQRRVACRGRRVIGRWGGRWANGEGQGTQSVWVSEVEGWVARTLSVGMAEVARCTEAGCVQCVLSSIMGGLWLVVGHYVGAGVGTALHMPCMSHQNNMT